MSLTTANSAKKAANRMRSEWLYSISVGVTTVPDLIHAANQKGGRPLRKVTLPKLLEAMGMGRARSERVLSHLRSHLGIKTDRRLNVAWLIDARTEGRRLHVWADALQERVTPWTGFPFAPCPPGGGVNNV